MEQNNSQANNQTNKQTGMLAILRALRSKANFERAGFSYIRIGKPVKEGGKGVKFEAFESTFPFNPVASTDEITDAIRETTELYRDSWVNPLIDALIEHAEGKWTMREIVRNLL